MLGLYGKISLILAMFAAFLQTLLPLLGKMRANPYLTATTIPTIIAQFTFVALAYLLLTYAFIANDFSLAYVAANSHPNLPFIYRLTAVWGAHEGSILLWVLILNIWSLVFAYHCRQLALLPIASSILGFISVCFLLFIIATSNPFLSSAIPSAFDLNPLLQDPGFIFHPPMLYAGYVGFSISFAITLAALLAAKLDLNWVKLARRWTLAAWCFLTLGITLGSWWAYRVLGWGGFWFWDPVENASLLPWLSGTALIHVLALVQKRSIAKNWAVILSITSFSLSLLGTFLVRSGVLISAHTFATDPARGVFLLLLFAIVVCIALTIYSLRIAKANESKTQVKFNFLARETGLLLNSALLFIAMATILLGTLYPIILDSLGLGSISIGAPYFNAVISPLILLLMALMGYVPFCHWQQENAGYLVKKILPRLLISISSALLLTWLLLKSFNLLASLSLALSIWVIISIIPSFRRLPGMAVAHVGFAIFIIGISLSQTMSIEREVIIEPGNIAQVGPYQFSLVTTKGIAGSNYKGIQAQFTIYKNKHFISYLYPEKRIYTVRNMVMTTVAIHPGIFRDLYIALGEPFDHEKWSVRIYYKPFIRWIWLGGLLMIMGGIITLLSPKHFIKDNPHEI
jgi:cytochrome c-type biogenesis protein CcmF